MFAIFHVHCPGGTFLARSESHPGWQKTTHGTLRESCERAERSLREHIQETVTFAHYEVPPGTNDALRAAA